jgi:hypothetical protein
VTVNIAPATALDILASHGADPARWPVSDSAAIFALAASDDDVADALADMRDLDVVLDMWAAAPAAGRIDVAAITAQRQLPAQPVWNERMPGWRPALLAASLALVVAVGGWLGLAGPIEHAGGARIAAVSPSAEPAVGEADAAFAYVFTPTAAEEDLI